MLRLAILVGLAAVIVAVVAAVDHGRKQDRENAAQEAAWFCAHGRPAACSDFDEVAYERRWERRELRYKIGFGVLAAGAITLALGAVRGRHPVRQ